jgi:hypothetical protein
MLVLTTNNEIDFKQLYLLLYDAFVFYYCLFYEGKVIK